MDTGARNIPVYSSSRISAVCTRTRIKMSQLRTPARIVDVSPPTAPASPIYKNIKWGEMNPADVDFSADQRTTLHELDAFLFEVQCMEVVAGTKPAEKSRSTRMSAKYLRDAKNFLVAFSPTITILDAAKHPVTSGELILRFI